MTRAIDLKGIKTVVIGRHSDTKRHDHMVGLTDKLGLDAQFPDGVTATPNFVGCGISHIRACNSDIKPPFLLLEDDVETTAEFTTDLSIPKDADIIFLGVTSYGLAPKLNGRALEKAAITEEHNDTYVKVHNMLGAHAILFVTESAREAYIAASSHYITTLFRPHDIAMVDLAKTHNIYALKDPSFYQATKMQAVDKKWPAERASKVKSPIREIGDTVDLSAGTFGRRKMRIIRHANGHLDWELIPD